MDGCVRGPEVRQPNPDGRTRGARPLGDRRLVPGAARGRGKAPVRKTAGRESGPAWRTRIRAGGAEAEQPQRCHDRADGCTGHHRRSEQPAEIVPHVPRFPADNVDATVIGKTVRLLNPPTPLGGRLRLLLAMSFLALPLVGGIWAFAGFAGRSGEQRAESQLAGELRAAVQSYEDVLPPDRRPCNLGRGAPGRPARTAPKRPHEAPQDRGRPARHRPRPPQWATARHGRAAGGAQVG